MSRLGWLGGGALVGVALATAPLAVGVAKDQAKAAPAPAAQAAQAAPIAVPDLAAGARLPSLAPLVAAVEPAVVAIEVESEVARPDLREIPPMFRPFTEDGPRTQHGEGSGFVVSADGLVLTNHHVIEGAREVHARFADGATVTLEVLGVDPATDIALCRLAGERKDWKYVELGDSSGVSVGDWVVAVGNPLGLGITVTAGIVSGKGRVLGHDAFDDFLQTDAAINQGNSGGPLFDLSGQVVGMNTAIIQGANTVGFSIPSRMLASVLEDLRTDGRVARGYLGVQLQPLEPTLAAAFGATDGALVADVQDGTPAARAGLLAGDVIVGVGEQAVKTSQDVILAVAGHAPGEAVGVDVLREGKPKRVQVTLGERPGAGPEGRAAPSPEEEEEQVATGRIGVTLGELPAEAAQRLGADAGALVQQVESGGPADGVLRPGDVIVEVNHAPVAGPDEVRAALSRGPTRVLLRIVRQGRPQYVAIDRAE